MAPRATWKGTLKFFHVECPVRLYAAVSASERTSFNQLHKDTHRRINMKAVEPVLGIVERQDLVKGYEYEDGRYVIIEDADLEKLQPEPDRLLKIEQFVDANDIDPICQDTPYYLAPDGAAADEAFILLRETLRKSRKVAIARIVLAGRDRVVTIGALSDGMIVRVIRAPSAMRNQAEYFECIRPAEPDGAMTKVLRKLVAQHTAPFEAINREDRYEIALAAMIEAKVKRGCSVVVGAPGTGNVQSLAATLNASLSELKPAACSKPRSQPRPSLTASV